MIKARRLLVLCCFLASGHVVSAIAPKPKIQLIPSKDNFVEDKQTTFTCHLLGSPTNNAKVSWLIRDRKTLINSFLSSNLTRLRQTKPQKLGAGQKSVFSVIMRRDFTNLFVVCRTVDCLEDYFRIPAIKKTNSIREVRFGWRHQVRGQRLVVHCDVDDPERVVKRMYFRVTYHFERAVKNRTLENSWIRFYLKRDTTEITTMEYYNGWPIQCFAVTIHERQNFGNVMSPTTTLVVHYLEFLNATFQTSMKQLRNSKTEITLGQRVSLSLVVEAHPRPPQTQFFVTGADAEAGVDRNWTVVERIDVLHITRFNVLLHFAPKKSGTFKVLFESEEVWENGRPIFSNSSDNFSVDVFYPYFENLTSHWHDKTFSCRKLFTDHFLLHTSPEPRVDQLQMLLLSEENPKVAEENYTRIVKIMKKENLYRVELTVIDPVTGTYVPVFRSGSLDVFGPQLRITIVTKVDKGYPVLIPIICFLLLIAIFAPIVCLRKRALKRTKCHVPVRVKYVNSSGKCTFDSRRSWSHNLVQTQFIHERIAPVVKVNVNGVLMEHPDDARPLDGDILIFAAPKSLRLYVVAAYSAKPVCEETMDLKPSDLTWGAVRHRAQRTIGEEHPILEDCAAFIFGRFCKPSGQLAIRVFEYEEIFFRDESTCEEVPRSDTVAYFWKFMTPSSTFRWPAGNRPVVELRTRSKSLLWFPEEFPSMEGDASQKSPHLEVIREGSDYSFRPLSDEASPDVVAFVQILADNEDNRYVRLTNGDHCRCRSAPRAQLFDSYEVVVKSHPHVPEDGWRREFLFFRADSELPNWMVPPNKHIIVFVREGVELDIENRRIKVIQDNARRGESEWVSPKMADEFQKKFTDIIRMRVTSIEFIKESGSVVEVPISPQASPRIINGE